MRKPKIELTTGSLVFLCAYGIFDPYHSFWAFLVSVVSHEVGHLLAIWIAKGDVLWIRASFTGIEIRTTPLPYKREIIVAMAGPFINLLLLLFIGKSFPVMGLVNGILLCYNLLPFYPLDGGRILRCALRLWLPLQMGDGIERIIGICTYCFLFVGALYLTFPLQCGLWPLLFCAFLLCRMGDILFPLRKQFRNNSLYL